MHINQPHHIRMIDQLHNHNLPFQRVPRLFRLLSRFGTGFGAGYRWRGDDFDGGVEGGVAGGAGDADLTWLSEGDDKVKGEMEDGEGQG